MTQIPLPFALLLLSAMIGIMTAVVRAYLKKINDEMGKMKTEIDRVEGCVNAVKKDLSGFHAGCNEKHRHIDDSLAEGRNRFQTLDKLIREEVRSINLLVQQLSATVGELKGVVQMAVNNNRVKDN